MSIRFACADCDARIKAPVTLVNRVIRCPRCGAGQRVPAESQVLADPVCEESSSTPATASPPTPEPTPVTASVPQVASQPVRRRAAANTRRRARTTATNSPAASATALADPPGDATVSQHQPPDQPEDQPVPAADQSGCVSPPMAACMLPAIIYPPPATFCPPVSLGEQPREETPPMKPSRSTVKTPANQMSLLDMLPPSPASEPSAPEHDGVPASAGDAIRPPLRLVREPIEPDVQAPPPPSVAVPEGAVSEAEDISEAAPSHVTGAAGQPAQAAAPKVQRSPLLKRPASHEARKPTEPVTPLARPHHAPATSPAAISGTTQCPTAEEKTSQPVTTASASRPTRPWQRAMMRSRPSAWMSLACALMPFAAAIVVAGGAVQTLALLAGGAVWQALAVVLLTAVLGISLWLLGETGRWVIRLADQLEHEQRSTMR